MNLENNLYKIIDKRMTEDGAIEYCLELLASSNIYLGHFPNHPITPGAVIMKIVEEILGERIRSCTNIKFLIPIIPSEATNIQIVLSTPKETESGKKYSAVIKDKNNIFAKLSVTL